MLGAAHTAFIHWAADGLEQNVRRARMLLAEVYALLGLGEAASYAHETHEYFVSNESPDWQVAFAHCILAHAAYAAGDMTIYRASFDSVVVALEAIADPEDKKS